MVRHIETSIFKPRSTRAESKADTTSAAATQIIESEEAARIAKTARLRAARLALPPAPEAAPKKRAAKK